MAFPTNKIQTLLAPTRAIQSSGHYGQLANFKSVLHGKQLNASQTCVYF